jgi:cytosine/adenosine deaminase-related metal-dependent hydrolase
MREQKTTIYRSRWVVPVSAPEIDDGAVAVRGGVILDVGHSSHILRTHRGEVMDLGEGILLPGFVNAHTHLELSALKGEVEAGDCFVDWVREVVRKRLALSSEQVAKAVSRQVGRLDSRGTVLIGDVANTLCLGHFLAKSDLRATIFREVIGFKSDDADDIFARSLSEIRGGRMGKRFRTTICPHGPHSVSPRLLKKILAHVQADAGVTTIHLAESREEGLFIREGRGPFRRFLEERGAWDPSWVNCPQGPVSYLDGLGFLRPGTLCVHLVQADEDDLRLLARRGVSACVCPRSNSHTGVGRAPVKAMLEAGLNVALGTDSLASNQDLNVLTEAQYLYGKSPGLEPRAVVRMFTLNGAEALGWPGLGSMSRGKEGRFVWAPVSGGRCEDPYRYLLEGVDPEEVKVV